jgi:hypothetical protein
MSDDVQLDDVLDFAEKIFEDLQQTTQALKESLETIKLQRLEIAKLQAEANGRLLADIFNKPRKRQSGRPKTHRLYTEEALNRLEELILHRKAEWGLKTDLAVIRKIMEKRVCDKPRYSLIKETELAAKQLQVALSKHRARAKTLKKKD